MPGGTGVLRFLRIGTRELEITGCWATVLAPRASHKLHSHPNNFLSGVYYVRTGNTKWFLIGLAVVMAVLLFKPKK